jgi:hypothetical protein
VGTPARFVGCRGSAAWVFDGGEESPRSPRPLHPPRSRWGKINCSRWGCLVHKPFAFRALGWGFGGGNPPLFSTKSPGVRPEIRVVRREERGHSCPHHAIREERGHSCPLRVISRLRRLVFDGGEKSPRSPRPLHPPRFRWGKIKCLGWGCLGHKPFAFRALGWGFGGGNPQVSPRNPQGMRQKVPRADALGGLETRAWERSNERMAAGGKGTANVSLYTV